MSKQTKCKINITPWLAYCILLSYQIISFGAANMASTPAAAPTQWKAIQEETKDSPHRLNWYNRQEMRKKAHQVYDQIVNLVGLVSNVMGVFLGKQKEIQEHLNNFYMNIGSILGGSQNAEEAVKLMLSNIEKMRKNLKSIKTKIKESDDREEKKRITGHEISLKNISLWTQDIMRNLKLLESAKKSLDDALETLNNEHNKAQENEQRAWNDYQKLDELISDTKANEHLKNIQAALKNNENIKEYIYTNFLSYFNQLVQKIVESTEAIQNEAQKLKQQAKDFEKIIQEELMQEETKRKEAEAAAEEELLRKEEAEKKARLQKEKELAEKNRSWYIKILDSVKLFFSSLTTSFSSFIKSINSFFKNSITTVTSFFHKKETPHASEKKKFDSQKNEHPVTHVDTHETAHHEVKSPANTPVVSAPQLIASEAPSQHPSIQKISTLVDTPATQKIEPPATAAQSTPKAPQDLPPAQALPLSTSGNPYNLHVEQPVVAQPEVAASAGPETLSSTETTFTPAEFTGPAAEEAPAQQAGGEKESNESRQDEGSESSPQQAVQPEVPSDSAMVALLNTAEASPQSSSMAPAQQSSQANSVAAAAASTPAASSSSGSSPTSSGTTPVTPTTPPLTPRQQRAAAAAAASGTIPTPAPTPPIPSPIQKKKIPYLKA